MPIERDGCGQLGCIDRVLRVGLSERSVLDMLGMGGGDRALGDVLVREVEAICMSVV